MARKLVESSQSRPIWRTRSWLARRSPWRELQLSVMQQL